MKSYKEIRLRIDNFSASQDNNKNIRSLDLQVPSECFNFKSYNGALVDGNGLEPLKLPIMTSDRERERTFKPMSFTFEQVWRYKYYSPRNGKDSYLLVVLGSDKKLYFTDIFIYDDVFNPAKHEAFKGDVDAITFRANEQDVIAFSSPKDKLLVWYCDDDPYVLDTAPQFKSICLHNGRLFAITINEKNIIRFSSKTNPLDWRETVSLSGGGHIELNEFKGEPQKLLSFLDNVYVFTDYGISKITSYSASSAYSINHFYSSSTKIYTQTACVCGEKILFLASDGLYECDGYDVKKLNLHLGKVISQHFQDKANSCFFNGNYYVACNLGSNEEKNDSLIEFNVDTKSYNIMRGVDICKMLPITDLFLNKLVVAVRGKNILYQLNTSGKIDENILEKSWKSGIIDLKFSDKDKILKDIFLSTDKEISLEIITDKEMKIYNILPSNKKQKIRCNIVGKEFMFTIKSLVDTQKISDLQLRFKVES